MPIVELRGQRWGRPSGLVMSAVIISVQRVQGLDIASRPVVPVGGMITKVLGNIKAK